MVASGPISYLFNAPDFVRYLPGRTSSRSIVWTVSLSSGLIALLLSVMGVLLASRGDMSDPIAGVEPFVPGWLFVLYILAAAGGSIANNVVAYYSSGLCLQSLGLPLKRHQATALDTVISTAIVLYILFVRDFTTVLHDFVALLVVWLGPFGGRMDHRRADAPLALRPGGDPRRHSPKRVLGMARSQSSSLARDARRRGGMPAHDECADLPGPGERSARRRRLHLDARAARERCGLLGSEQAKLSRPRHGDGACIGIELAVDRAHVGLDGVAGDV